MIGPSKKSSQKVNQNQNLSLFQRLAQAVDGWVDSLKESWQTAELFSQKENDELTGAEEADSPEKPLLENYIRIGEYYISKKLLGLIALITVVVVAIVILVAPLPLIAKWTGRYAQFQSLAAAGDYTGKAKILDDSGAALRYVGDLVNGQFSGTGKLYENGQLIYAGEFKEGRREGAGESWQEGQHYRGAFANDTCNGDGVILFSTGKVHYTGKFENGRLNGEGKEFYPDGTTKFAGIFTNGQPSGQGTEFFPGGGIKYKGDYLAGKYSGTGVLYYENGKKQLAGAFLLGMLHGSGEEYDEQENLRYKGGYQDGKYAGLGTLMHSDGAVIYSGFFAGGEIDMSRFLGMSKAKIEEALGKPAQVEALPQPDKRAVASSSTRSVSGGKPVVKLSIGKGATAKSAKAKPLSGASDAGASAAPEKPAAAAQPEILLYSDTHLVIVTDKLSGVAPNIIARAVGISGEAAEKIKQRLDAQMVSPSEGETGAGSGNPADKPVQKAPYEVLHNGPSAVYIGDDFTYEFRAGQGGQIEACTVQFKKYFEPGLGLSLLPEPYNFPSVDTLAS
ncbi:hypothetical protein GTO89_14800 [Heliobacterium gestii]|uniref:MORN repeat protein n=1 Tax=Heliomicrobium gestii TaxID=2699 RepID=A0A845LFF9_HELGE|nr:hypothetical protein [Heliomicrobium gestii]MBM7868035.1 antitoxin component YwqK of YwqJK toxin-antitoxin module [Heliomicrobium gestii]MZP44301.1 hypothetical protein [Heliomicrobium gestii]